MLYIVPTPIGNLHDLTFHAFDVLKNVDGIVCEDTRRTQRLLNHYKIKKPLVSYHDHSSPQKILEIIQKIEAGKTLALVSDSGTPLVSDPGFPVVREAIRKGIRIEALPGPCAFVAALSASGLPAESFSFFGFLSQKSSARRRRLEALSEREETLIFYESPHRLLKLLEEMREIFGDREAVIARELTKKYEEISRGYLSDLIEKFSRSRPLGEFVLLVAGKDRKETLHV